MHFLTHFNELVMTANNTDMNESAKQDPFFSDLYYPFHLWLRLT